ncbi:MAG: ATP phosphoribosyltransferase regulatory subunit [Candidatus Pacebacteria bacterium]|nr:ATP phosphoribosyltransferase regulatory subunit [Candidatus Paceibacterota bacterium]
MANFYGFDRIAFPIIEKPEIYLYGLGKETDLVNKEMQYIKTGKNGLVLRPKGTASAIRLVLNTGLLKNKDIVKLFYSGPFFRKEKGNIREFNQTGFEIIGVKNAICDVELINTIDKILQELNLDNFYFEINSQGCKNCLKDYLKQLEKYFKSKKAMLCPSCKKHLENKNILQILQCTKEKCQALLIDAPHIQDSLCQDCKKNYTDLVKYLKSLNIPFKESPFIFRDIKYYTSNIFNVYLHDELIGQGGRYDNLLEVFGANKRPASGIAINSEKILSLMNVVKEIKKPSLFLIQLGDSAKEKSFEILETLRKNDLLTATSLSKGSIKEQMKIAKDLNIEHVLIIGQEEANREEIIFHELTSGLQETIPFKKLINILNKRLKK